MLKLQDFEKVMAAAKFSRKRQPENENGIAKNRREKKTRCLPGVPQNVDVLTSFIIPSLHIPKLYKRIIQISL